LCGALGAVPLFGCCFRFVSFRDCGAPSLCSFVLDWWCVFFSRVLVPLVMCHGEALFLAACGRLETELAGMRRLGTLLAGKRSRVVHLLTVTHPCRMPPCTRGAHEENCALTHARPTTHAGQEKVHLHRFHRCTSAGRHPALAHCDAAPWPLPKNDAAASRADHARMTMRTVLKSARSHGSSMYRAVWRSYRYFLKGGGKEAAGAKRGEHTATPGQ